MVVFLVVLFVQAPGRVQAATNKAPTATAQSVVTNEDTALLITFTGSDPEGSALSYTVTTNPSKGTLSACSANHCLYTPKSNLSGTDSLAFKVSDGSLTSKAAARVTITVNAVNDAPVATSNSYSIGEDNSLTIVLQASDVERDSLTFKIVSQPTSVGTVSLNGNAATFTGLSNRYGQDSFSFTASDGKATSAPATISMTVNAVNDAPTATDQNVNVTEDVPLVLPLNVSDVDGDTLTASTGYGSAHGTLVISGATVTYTPDAQYNGADSFTYRVNDGVAYSGVATVSITVNAVNDLPVTENTYFEVTAGGSAIGSLSGTDTEGSALTFSIVGQGSHGRATVTEANTFTYKADAGYSGIDSFSFVASDGTDLSTVGVASVKILAVGAFTPVFSSALETLNLPVSVSGDKTVTTMASDPCYRTAASPLILSGRDFSGAAIEYAVGTLFSTCKNHVELDGYQYFVRTDTGEAFSLSSVLDSLTEPNALGASTFDGNTLITPLVSTKIASEDPDEPTGGLLITQFNEDGTTTTVYDDSTASRAVPAPILLVDDMAVMSTINDAQPTCQRGAKIQAEFCGIFAFINAFTQEQVAIAFPEDNGYEASYWGAARATVKNSGGNIVYDRIVWGSGAGGNNWDGLNVGSACRIHMVDKSMWWNSIASGTFADFEFFASELSEGVISFDPGDAGCTDGANTDNGEESTKSAIMGATIGFDSATKLPQVWVKGNEPDVYNGSYTRISQFDQDLNLSCEFFINSGTGKSPFNGNNGFAIDRNGVAYTNADFYNEQGVLHTGVFALDPTDCSSELILDFNVGLLDGSLGGVSLAEDANGNTQVLVAGGGSLHTLDLSTMQYETLALGSSHDDNVSAAPVLDSAGRVIVISNNNVMSITKPTDLSYGLNFWARPGRDNWGSNTAMTTL